MPTVFIYSRVSTTSQELSPVWQAQVCTTYYEASLREKGYDLHPEVFHDHGVSAFKVQWRERPKGRELFALVKPGDVILVAKQDRVFRSTLDKEQTMRFLAATGIDIAVLDLMLDTTTAAGRFAARVVAAQCEFESDIRSERTKAAHVIRRQQKKPMKKRPPPGWKLDRALDQLVPDWDERKFLAEIYRRQRQGIQPLRDMARECMALGLKRRSGGTYNWQWLHRAYSAFLNNFPMEGFLSKNRHRDSYRVQHKLGNFKRRKTRLLSEGETISPLSAWLPAVY